MKLHTENHEFLMDIALRLMVEQNHMIDLFNEVGRYLINADNTASKSLDDYVNGKIAKAELDADMNTVGDLIVVHQAYDKLSDAFSAAFDAVSSYHVTRMQDDPDFSVN